MPRGRVSKIDLESRTLKLKNALYNGEHSDKSGEWHDGAHEMLNRVLQMLNEYSL